MVPRFYQIRKSKADHQLLTDAKDTRGTGPKLVTEIVLELVLARWCVLQSYLWSNSYDAANSVYASVVVSLMGPLFVNNLAKKYSYGNLGYCKATAGVPDVNYTNATFLIQNYEVKNIDLACECIAFLSLQQIALRSNVRCKIVKEISQS